jgi:hypothetical protein
MKRIYILLLAVLCCLTTKAYSVSEFTGVETDSGVVISWRTESEVDCFRWEIERSFFADSNYQTMAILDGHGTTNEPHDYTWTDTTVVAVNTYYYRLASIDGSGASTYFGPIPVLVSLFGVAGEPVALPQLSEDILLQSYPNPFNYSTKITYNLARPGRVSIKVYNTAGQLIRVLSDGFKPAGRHSEAWNGRDCRNEAVANGVYFYCLVTGNRFSESRIILIK